MDRVTGDLVHLSQTQAGHTEFAGVHLRILQEDTRMLEPEVVDRIRDLSGQGFGSKRIARELKISRNTVRRYLAGGAAGYQERPAARRLDRDTLQNGSSCHSHAVVAPVQVKRHGPLTARKSSRQFRFDG